MKRAERSFVLIPSMVGLCRARVSHSFLDHELLYVSCNAAVARWRLGEWVGEFSRLNQAFRSYERDAVQLGDQLMEFSPGAVIDQYAAFQYANEETRAALKRVLDDWYVALFSPAKARASYLERVCALRSAIEQFRKVVNEEDTTQASIERGWTEVLEAAEALKRFLNEERIPRDIVLPLELA